MPRFIGNNASTTNYSVRGLNHTENKTYAVPPAISGVATGFNFACRDDEADDIAAQLDASSGVTYQKSDTNEHGKLFYFADLAAKSANSVHASIQANALFTTFVNPAAPRNLRVVFGAGWDGGDVTVVGTNQFDQPVSETFATGTNATRVGVKIFKTVTSATFTAGTAGGTHTATIGTGDKIGILANVIGAFGKLDLAGVVEAVTIDATYDAFTPTTVPDASVDYLLLVNV